MMTCSHPPEKLAFTSRSPESLIMSTYTQNRTPREKERRYPGLKYLQKARATRRPKSAGMPVGPSQAKKVSAKPSKSESWLLTSRFITFG